MTQTGAFVAYNGVAAVNNDGGKYEPKRPAYMLRYKAVRLAGAGYGWYDAELDG